MDAHKLPADYVNFPLVERQEYVNNLQKEVQSLQATLDQLRSRKPEHLLSGYKSQFVPYAFNSKWKANRTYRTASDRFLNLTSFTQGSSGYPSIASVSQDGMAIAWDVDSGLKYDAFNVGKGNLMTLSVSPNGKILVVGGLNCTVDVYSLGEDLRQQTSDPDPPFTFLSKTPTGFTDTTRADQYRFSLSGHYAAVGATHFMDETNLVSGSQEGIIFLWDLLEGQSLITLNEQSAVNSVSSPSPYMFCTTANSGQTKVWDVRDKNSAVMCFSHNSPMRKCKFMPEGESIFASDGTSLMLYDLRSNATLETYTTSSGTVSTFNVAPSGRLAFIGDDAGATHCMDLIHRSEFPPVDIRKDVVSGIEVVDNQVIIGSWDGSLKGYLPPN